VPFVCPTGARNEHRLLALGDGDRSALYGGISCMKTECKRTTDPPRFSLLCSGTPSAKTRVPVLLAPAAVEVESGRPRPERGQT
jgi:hypothetical protein